MRPYPILFLTTLACLYPITIKAAVSAEKNGLYVVVIGQNPRGHTNSPIWADDELLWKAFCSTGEVRLLIPMDRSYLVKIRMLDSKGKEVSKTALGRSYGARFADLLGHDTTRLTLAIANGRYEDNPQLGGGRYFARPQELFEMKQAGVYTMEIQIQAFRYPAGPTNKFCFPPVVLKIEKDSED